MRRPNHMVRSTIALLLLVLLLSQAGHLKGRLCATQPPAGATSLSESAVGSSSLLPRPSSDQAKEVPIRVDDPSETEDGVQYASKIAKITMLYGEVPESYERSLALHRAHNKEHGYKMFVLGRKTLRGMWSKVAYMLSIIEQELEKPNGERLQWLFWVDADVVVMNPRIPLELFLPPQKDFDHVNMLVTADQHGLNTGTFFVRINEWALRFFAETIALTTYLPEVKLKYSDQSAMAHLINETEKYRNTVVYIPQRWTNAYNGPYDAQGQLIEGRKIYPNNFKKGDIHIHFAGNKPERKAPMPHWVDVAEHHLPEWEMNSANTSYPSEIATFWDEERRKLAALQKANGRIKRTAAVVSDVWQ